MCAKCCFNLSGQTIVRERHYGLLIVRCPECGTPAALQEYPALGRWGARLGYLAAAIWFGFMILFVIGSAGAFWGEVEEITGKLASPYTDAVDRGWKQYVQDALAMAQKAGTATAPANTWMTYGYNPAEEEKWWRALDKDGLFRALGGWWHGGIAWNSLWSFAEAALVVGSFGCVMAICTPHLRKRGRLGMVLLVIALGGAISVISWLGRTSGWRNYPGYYTSTEPYMRLWPYLMPPVVVACGVLYAIGVWQGRRVARWVVAFLLPPRMRGPLAFLWHADGLPMPRPRR
jgi:hypothetical protein